MNKIFELLRLFTIVLFFSAFTNYSSAQEISQYSNGQLKGSIKIKLKPDMVSTPSGLKSIKEANGFTSVGISGIDKLNIQFKAVEMERLFPYSPKHEAKHQKHGLHLWYKVKVESEEQIKRIVQAYSQLSEVQVAEPFYQKSLIPYSITELTETIKKGPTADRDLEYPFDDPRFEEQWHYYNTEDNVGTVGADINLLKAWERQVGQPNVVIAVLDQGVDVEHEDLKANMWVNEAELNGTPGEDSDGNGYIDDINGFNFVTNTGKIEALPHGTHVAGTVAATNNNGIGVAGVAGGSGQGDGVRIMSCMIMGESSNGDAESAFVYSADNGAVISQNSWGYNTPDVSEQSILDAIDYFVAEAGDFDGSPMKGGVVIFAAGNNGEEGNYWPGCYDKVIAVAATESRNAVAPYSNFGDWVDISAPGGDVGPGQEYGVLSTMPDNSYGFYDGTSMACPHVSGVAGLIVSEFGGADFNSEQLTARLLAGTNVLDTMEINSYYKGKMGVGGTDAYLALLNDEGIAPEQITDLESKGESSTMIRLNWTVPADEDDDEPRYFNIYHYDEEITPQNKRFVNKVVESTSQKAGTLYNYELKQLEANTEYYIVVTGVDRWGNEASLSNQIIVNTNNGPKIVLNPWEIDFSINVLDNPTYSESFIIKNEGEGILSWNAETRHVENVDDLESSINRIYYKTPNTGNSIPEISSATPSEGAQIEPFEQKPEHRYLFHFDDEELAYTMSIIGDSDIKLPNSQATKYHVNNTLGFNLTGVEIGLNFEAPISEPIYLEILKGDDINTAELVHREIFEVEGNPVEFESMDLSQQIYFNQGDVFFIVLHTPPGHRYPFLASQGQNEESSNYSYISTDQGKTWKLLPDVYYDPSKVWCAIAMNNLVELDEYISLDKTNGYLYPGEQEEINFTVVADSLINGDYISNIQVYGVGYEKYWEKLKLSFGIRGQKYKMESPDILDYGNVFIGVEQELEIPIMNVGLGAFHSGTTDPLRISISDSDFSLVGLMPQTIKAERTENLKFKYKPTKEGAVNATVTITEQDGGTHQFNLFGIGTIPPKAEVNPAEKDYNDLVLGEDFTGFFNLENKGLYPLQYYVPSFADGANMPDFDDQLVHRFGYVAGHLEPEDPTDPEDEAFDWVDISGTGTDVTEKFLLDGSVVFVDALLGFSFPFFGNTYDTCYITNQGAVSLVNEGWFNAKPAGYNSDAQPSKLISAWGMPFDLHISGKIYYEAFPGKLIIQYHEVSHGCYFFDEDEETGIGWRDEAITFQIVLHQNGDINYNYKDLGTIIDDQNLGFNRSATLISIEDFDEEDQLVLNGFGTSETDPQLFGYSPTTGQQVFFKNPGYGSVKELTNPYGTVPVGGSVKIEYTVDTDSLYVGQFQERINIVTTDPITNPVTHAINISITSGGEAEITFDQEVVDFGDVFEGATVTKTLVVGNDGRAIGFINKMAVENNRYTIDGYMPVELHPGTFSDYTITLNATNRGLIEDNIVFTTDEGTELIIPVTANVIEAPFIGSGTDKISETLKHGETISIPVQISNTGNNPMLVTPSANEWISALPKGQDTYLPGSDYGYTIEYDENSIFYAPTNVKEVGEKWEGPENPLDPETYWNAFPLPFEVPFYGEMYDTVYVAVNGVITFIPGQEATEMGPIYYIPNEEGIQGFLAPLYCMGGLASPEYFPEAGIYMHDYDDKFVIRYQDLESFGGGSTVSVEVWIFKNGVIKYLFDVPEHETANILHGIVGVQNQDGTSGIQVSANTKGVIFDKTVVTLVPQETYEVEANSSMDFDVVLNAETLYGGNYQDDLVFKNNTPSAPDFSIPVNLEIIGEDNIVINDTLTLGDLYIVTNPDEESQYPNLYYDFNFTIHNEGSNPLDISRIILDYGFNLGIVMGDNEKFGDPESDVDWVDIGSRWINYTIKPHNHETFNLRVMPVNLESISDNIVIICNTEEGEIEMPITANFINPPVVTVDTDRIDVFANTDDEHHERSFNFKNTGASNLDYTLEVEFNRESQNFSTNSIAATNFFTSASAMQIQKTGTLASLASPAPMFDSEDYNNVLDHDNAESTEMAVGFGGGDWQFCTATKFDAPGEGFNLSHVVVWYNWGTVTDSEIEVEIRGESNIFYNTKVLHTTTHRHRASEATKYGDFVTIDLGEELFFYPKEKFYVVIKFPSNVEYPQGVSQVAVPEHDRFFFGDGSAYFDAIDAGYGVMSWMVKAAEVEASSNFWVMIDNETEGTLKPGEESTVDLTFASIFAQQGANNAAIAIHSNDPVDSTKSVPVTLTRNMGPQYPDGNAVYFSMYEMDTIQYRLRPFDAENDDFTVKVVEDKPYFSYTQDGNNITFWFAPDYDGEGDHFIEVEGTDEHGNTTFFAMNVSVTNVNRAPEVSEEIGEQIFPLESDEGIYMDFSQYITDPDGDELAYEIIYSDTDVLTHAQDDEVGSEVLFFPRRLGDIYITVKATDPEGAYVTTGFHAFVEHRVGVDDVDKNRLAIYPNPVTDYLNIQMTGSVTGDSKIQLFNATGQQVFFQERSLSSLYQLDMRQLAVGIYILKVTHGDDLIVKKITKR